MSFFTDTLFGFALRNLSGGRLFAYQDSHDAELRQRFLNGPVRSDDSSDEEKKESYKLIEFLEDDEDNPRNWSLGKKAFVTFDICFLTLSVYMGSAIYTSGLMFLIEDFHTSQTVVVLGLTLYVLGYGIGPMVWVRALFPTTRLLQSDFPPSLLCLRFL